MAANAQFAIEIEFISNAVAEFSKLEKISKRGAARIRNSLTKLIDTQLKLRKAQATLADAFRAASKTVGLSTVQININKAAVAAAAVNVQLLKEQLVRVKNEYTGAAIAGKGFLASLIAQRQNALDLSKRLDVAIKKIITYRIAFGVFRQATEAFKDMFVQAIDMDDALGDLQKVLRGTSGDMERLRDAAFDFGIAFGRTPKDIVEGFKTFAQQGLDVNGILERTNALMLAVSATTLNTRDAIRALTVASKNFGQDFDNLEVVIDKFLVSERAVPVAAKDFADALAVVGQPAKELGLTLDELNGIVAAIGEVTQKTGKAIGTSLKTILSRSTSKDSIRAFQGLGIAVLKTQNEFRPFGDILRDLGKQWPKLTQVQRLNIATVLGQRRRYQDFLALMSNFDQFLNVTAKSQEALNDAQLAANVELDKFRRRIESVNTAFIQLKESVGRDLLESLINLDGGFSSTLQTITANSSSISKLITITAKLIGLFALARAGIFVLGGGLRLLGVNYLALTVETAAAAGATARFGFVLQGLRATLGPIFLAVSLATGAYLLWKSATDKTARSQKELADIVRDNKAAVEEADLAIQKLKLSTDEFSKLKVKIGIQKLLIQVTKDIETANDEFNKFSKGTGLKSSFIGLSFGTIVTKEDSKNIQAANDQMRILIARSRGLRSAIKQVEGKEVLPVDLRAEAIVKNIIALERLEKAARSISLLKPGEQFEGFTLSDLGFGNLGVDERKLTVEGKESIQKLIERIKKDIILPDKARLFLPFEVEIKDPSQVFFKQIDLFSRIERQARETNFTISNFNRLFEEQRSIAQDLGRPFNEAAKRLQFFGKILESVIIQRQKLESRRSAFQEQLDENLKTIIDTDGKVKEIGLSEQDQAKTEGEIVRLNKEINLLVEREGKFRKENIEDIKSARRELIGQLQTRLALDRALAANNSSLDKQKIALGVLSVATTTQSQSGFKVAEALAKQLSIDKELIKLDFQRAENAANNAIAKENLLKSDESVKNIAKIVSDLNIKRLDTTNKIIAAESKVTKALIRQAQALKQEIASSISAGLTAIPSNIADRTKAENNLAIKRKELEFEIADFRKQLSLTTTETERSRINQNILEAQRGLRKLQQDAKELGNIFTDVFDALGGIANIAFRKSTENLVDALLDVQIGGQGIGQTLATQIGGSITEAGFQVANELTTASALSAVNTGSAITVAHQTGGLTVKFDIIDGHIIGIDIGTKKIELAHKKGAAVIGAAVQIGAQLLGQAIGGGGSRAGIGAGIGSLLGSLLGPVGTIAGGAAGGFIGGLFDSKRDFIEPLSSLTSATNRNSTAIENNNKLLELSRDFINAPARFTPPPVQGSFSGGITGVTIQNVNINASTSAGGSAAARGFIAELDKSFNNSVRSNRSTARTFG